MDRHNGASIKQIIIQYFTALTIHFSIRLHTKHMHQHMPCANHPPPRFHFRSQKASHPSELSDVFKTLAQLYFSDHSATPDCTAVSIQQHLPFKKNKIFLDLR